MAVIPVLISALQGYAVSLTGERSRVNSHWKRGLSFLRIGLAALQMDSGGRCHGRVHGLAANPLQELEPCISSRRARRRQAQAGFSTIEMLPPLRSTDHKPQLAVT